MRSTSMVFAPVVAASAPRAIASGRASRSKSVPLSSPRMGSWLEAMEKRPAPTARSIARARSPLWKLPSLAVRVAFRGAPPRISTS